MSASISARPERVIGNRDAKEGQAPFPALPTETEIYILPDGRVIVADLPLELASLTEALGSDRREAAPHP